MGRPRIWQPFETVKWASHYELTDAGEIRDQHRNVLPLGEAPYDVSLRLYDTARKRTFPRRDILALEYFGPPPTYRCVICDKPLPTDVLHLNRNPRDFSRDNLKYAGTFTGRAHEIKCLRWAMEWNEIPPRVRTVRCGDKVLRNVDSMPNKGRARSAAQKLENQDWGDTLEDIPFLGVNESE